MESWTLDAVFCEKGQQPEFSARLRGEKGVKGNIVNGGEEARRYQSQLQDATYTVANVKKQTRVRMPDPPFTTST